MTTEPRRSTSSGRRCALVVAAVLVLGGMPRSALSASATASLSPSGDTTLAQGVPFEFQAVITNTGSLKETFTVTFDIQKAGGAEAPVPFLSTKHRLNPGQSTTTAAKVVSSQWFTDLATFEIVPKMGTEIIGNSLQFTVTSPTITVPTFADATAESGITMSLPNSACGADSAGAAAADFDSDGDVEFFVPSRTSAAKLFINDGSGRFTEEAAQRGADNPGYKGIAASAADYDNDGDQDIYVVNNNMPNRLYRNNGTGHFTDVAPALGVDVSAGGSSAAWGDYDADGRLDLYVTNHSDCAATPSKWDVLYHQESDGTFTDRTSLVEQDPATRTDGATDGLGFQAGWFDGDSDGDQDLTLANDRVGGNDINHYWRNSGPGNGDWQLIDVSAATGMNLSMNAMGLAIGDPDRDLDFDVVYSNIGSKKLARNNGDGTFTESAAAMWADQPYQVAGMNAITWGLVFVDLNNDGWEDLFVGAGPTRHIERKQTNQVLVNDGTGRFLDLRAPSGAMTHPGQTRGIVPADYDLDGDVDLLLVNQSGSLTLWRNTTASPGHWLQVRTVGTSSNRDGCGARLVASLPDGSEAMRHVDCGSSSLGSSIDKMVHFGLGAATGVSQLDIYWPSGMHQVVTGVGADKRIIVTEPAGP